MFKLKYLSHLFLATLVAMVAVMAPLKLMAQDDEMPDQETIMPSSSNTSPPPIIDESDSNSVSDSDEYDG